MAQEVVSRFRSVPRWLRAGRRFGVRWRHDVACCLPQGTTPTSCPVRMKPSQQPRRAAVGRCRC